MSSNFKETFNEMLRSNTFMRQKSWPEGEVLSPVDETTFSRLIYSRDDEEPKVEFFNFIRLVDISEINQEAEDWEIFEKKVDPSFAPLSKTTVKRCEKIVMENNLSLAVGLAIEHGLGVRHSAWSDGTFKRVNKKGELGVLERTNQKNLPPVPVKTSSSSSDFELYDFKKHVVIPLPSNEGVLSFTQAAQSGLLVRDPLGKIVNLHDIYFPDFSHNIDSAPSQKYLSEVPEEVKLIRYNKVETMNFFRLMSDPKNKEKAVGNLLWPEGDYVFLHKPVYDEESSLIYESVFMYYSKNKHSMRPWVMNANELFIPNFYIL